MSNKFMNNRYKNIENLPYFTVIIPQKDRAEFLIHTLKTCMIQDYPKFEIIVSDDCSEDDSVAVVEKLAMMDSRIRLFPHKQHLGMRENFEFALNQVKPGYVIALGGDDGLVPGCIWRMYEIITETKTDLLTWRPASFMYPENSKDPTFFSVPRVKRSGYRYIKSEIFLNKMARTLRYLVDDCPMIYVKGVASTRLIEKVKSRTGDGKFYYCPTPDGFSGIVLAGEVERYVYVEEPLSIVGTTHKSQGKNYGRTDKKSREEAEQFFNDNVRKTMHSELASQPYSPLTTLMTADYLLTARDLPGWPGKFKMFEYNHLIKTVFKQISTTFFDDSVLVRELQILKEIAKQHNLQSLYNELYKSTVRKKFKNNIRYGFAITNSFRFDGREMNLANIFEASLAVNFAYRFCNKLSPKLFAEGLIRSLKIVADQKKYLKSRLPQIDN